LHFSLTYGCINAEPSRHETTAGNQPRRFGSLAHWVRSAQSPREKTTDMLVSERNKLRNLVTLLVLVYIIIHEICCHKHWQQTAGIAGPLSETAAPLRWEHRAWNAIARATNLAVARTRRGSSRDRWFHEYGNWWASSVRLGNVLGRSPREPIGRYTLRQEWSWFVELLEESLEVDSVAPTGQFEGTGIVMAIGRAQRYAIPALVTLRLLRLLGCRLPVEFWYSSARGESPFDSGLEAALRRMNRVPDTKGTANEAPIYFRDLDTVVPRQRDLGGWESLFAIKPLAIAFSRFAHVLYLDADAHPLRDPTYLFSLFAPEAVSETRSSRIPTAVFWPDYWIMPVDHPAFSIFRVVPRTWRERREQESSVLLVDKSDVHESWIPLMLSVMLNVRSDYTYQYLHGDKDTFRFAWMALDAPFDRIEVPPAAAGHWSSEGLFHGTTMVQHDPNGKPLVLHHNLEKLDACSLDRSARWWPSGRLWDAVQFGGQANWTTQGRWIGPSSRICFTGTRVKTVPFEEYIGQDFETQFFRPALDAVLTDAFAKRHRWSRCRAA